jgi:hypothetical protein
MSAAPAEWAAINAENPRYNAHRRSPYVDDVAETEADARWHDSREAIDVG